MPTYEYRVPRRASIREVPEDHRQAPHQMPGVRQGGDPVISGGAGLVFRGTGFYITDYGKDGKGPRKAEEKPAAEKPAEKKSETSAGKETKQAEPAAKKAKPE